MKQVATAREDGRFRVNWLQRAATVWRACSLRDIGREIVAGWYFVSLDDPPDCAVTVVTACGWVYWPAAILMLAKPDLFPRWLVTILAWGQHNLGVTALLLPLNWFLWLAAVVVLLWAAANGVLLLVHLVAFPCQFGRHACETAQAGWRAWPRFEAALSRWLPADETARIFGQAMRHGAAVRWPALDAPQLLARLIECNDTDLLELLPKQAWPELVALRLSPAALTIVFGRSLHDGAIAGRVLGVVVARGLFNDPAQAASLVRQLAALPAARLARMLETVCELDAGAREGSIRGIFLAAQRGDGPAVGRFVAAIGLVSVRVCEAAVAGM